MRVVMRTCPLLLVLGVALTGCDRTGTGPAPDRGDTASVAPSESDYVLTVEGMR
jgi:hypothetical protein